ncbi:MAG: hypothetical protein CMD31_00720 [Flavobacteriales bacterium]|nr:hypothetical protein [Flavobacteriales bacterium]|tara:strand:+ start:6606 stop:7592 length:987 start_codon:yes stop_codon:yes gene_type:complete
MKKTLFILILLISNNLFAQSKTEFTLTLKDGNIVTGTTKVSNVLLITDYGKLDIPIKNVSSISLGIHPDNSLKNTIVNLAKQLQSAIEDNRKKAYDQLVNLKISAIPVIEEVLYSETQETPIHYDYSLTTALSELKAIHSVGNSYSTKDIITIDYEYSMGGKYDFSTVSLKTEYGDLTIPREKIEKIDILYIDASADSKTFKLMASTHISSNQNGGWLKTGIVVKPGQNISMTASGEVVLASLSNNAYKPDGSVKNSSSDDFNTNSSTSTSPAYGNVVFKIGDSGTVTKAGAKYNGKASAAGMLYISIYETVYNASNTGFYVTNVTVK